MGDIAMAPFCPLEAKVDDQYLPNILKEGYLIVVVLGGPASGKGTRSKYLAEKLGLPHISTGDLLRKEAETNPFIDELLYSGHFVPDEIVESLLEKRMWKEDCEHGVILDGYPRSEEQVFHLAKILDVVQHFYDKETLTGMVIDLKVSDEEIVRRILGRKVCSACGATFFNPEFSTCDKCDGPIISRSDDTEATIQVRIQRYKDNFTKVNAAFLSCMGLVPITLNSEKNPEAICNLFFNSKFIK